SGRTPPALVNWRQRIRNGTKNIRVAFTHATHSSGGHLHNWRVCRRSIARWSRASAEERANEGCDKERPKVHRTLSPPSCWLRLIRRASSKNNNAAIKYIGASAKNAVCNACSPCVGWKKSLAMPTYVGPRPRPMKFITSNSSAPEITRWLGWTSLCTNVTVADRKNEFRNIGPHSNSSASGQCGAHTKPRKNGSASSSEIAGIVAYAAFDRAPKRSISCPET